MHEYGYVLIDGHWRKAIRFTDSGIVHVYKPRANPNRRGRPERVSRQIAKTFKKGAE